MALLRRLTVLAAAVLLVGATAVPAGAQEAPPHSMASLGDSITRGFNACGFYLDCTSRSFSTGSSGFVDSHYLRIRTVAPRLHGHNHNLARSGATVADLPGQARSAVTHKVEYVTILIGANDACARDEAGMTPVPVFRQHVDEALAVLNDGLPHARVLVISIPDLKRLWQVGRGSLLARAAWSLLNICQSMLAAPTSTAEPDEDRRDRVRRRVIDYNAELAAACAAYGPRCRFDDNAVFNYPFTLAHLSGWDYFHPNRSGQQVLAEISYPSGFGW